MLGIIKTCDRKTGDIKSVIAKNDCDFDFHEADERLEGIEREGYASLGTVYKYNPIHCRKYDEVCYISIYRNCNEKNTMFFVAITGDGITFLDEDFCRTIENE